MWSLRLRVVRGGRWIWLNTFFGTYTTVRTHRLRVGAYFATRPTRAFSSLRIITPVQTVVSLDARSSLLCHSHRVTATAQMTKKEQLLFVLVVVGREQSGRRCSEHDDNLRVRLSVAATAATEV